MNTEQVLKAIETERQRQIRKWGDQKHSHGQWLLILQEELGEVSKVVLEGVGFENNPHLIEEMVQAAAVITAWIEDYTRAPDKTTDIELRQLYGGQDHMTPFNDAIAKLTELQVRLLQDIYHSRNNPRVQRHFPPSEDHQQLLALGLIKTKLLKSGREPDYGYTTTAAGEAVATRNNSSA